MKNLSNHFFGAMIFTAMLLSLNACTKNDDKPDNTVDFNATLNEAQETPPTGESGTGTCTATYNNENNELNYTLTWNGLTGVPTAMHFHKAGIGVAGDVEIPITGFTASASGMLTASAIVDEDEAQDLLEGKFYVNIHTAAHPGGEIRGQLIKQ